MYVFKLKANMNHEVYESGKVSDQCKLLSALDSITTEEPITDLSLVKSTKALRIYSEDNVPVIDQPKPVVKENGFLPAVDKPAVPQNGDLECLDDTLTDINSVPNDFDDSFVEQLKNGGETNLAFECEDDVTTPRPQKFQTAECAVTTISDIVIQEHEVIIVEKAANVPSAPGRALRKLDPRKLNLTLDLFSSKNKKKDRLKSSGSSSNASSLSPKSTSPFHSNTNIAAGENPEKPAPVTKKTIKTPTKTMPVTDLSTIPDYNVMEQPTIPKKSWLLRLFESQVR